MKKQLFFLAVAALALASCSSENDVVQSPNVVEQTADDGAVNFDVYVGRGLTRGGVNGPVTTETLTNSGDDHGKAGFGVFGYYTDGEPYSAITKPNFFYNQQVKYESGKWTYTPLKYWPNEFGSDAASDQVDRVTLFAYLPWVEVDPLTGVTKAAGSTADPVEKKAKDPTTNITGMTRNTSTGDPFIKYVTTMDPTNSVDLCYGVAAENFTSSNSAINQNYIKKGEPYIDVKKPGTDANSKIKFDFKHATAQLKVTIDANVTDLTTPGSAVQTDYTRIWVRSVTFTGITQKGSLNLNSKAGSPEWYDLNGNSKITTGSLTVYDGRKDGKEANDAASNESPATLNPKIVQAKQYTIDGTPKHITAPDEKGVTETRVDLFGEGKSGAPVFVIPTKEKMRVTIVYDVETYDPNLPYFLSDGKTPGSSIENTIYKDIDTFGDITAGYCYTLNLHLGMRTVDFDAEVTPWQYYGADVDLPSNLQTFAIGTTTNPKLTLPAGVDPYTYQFAVSGLTVNYTPTLEFNLGGTDISAKASATPANGSGISIITVTGIDPNTTVLDKKGTGNTWVITDGSVTTNKVTIDVTQLAAPLGMSINAVNNRSIEIKKEASTEWGSVADATDQDVFKVWKNGNLMEVITATDPTKDNQVRCTAAGTTATLKFNSNFVAGDIITVWVKPGDATEESVTANIAGISYAPGTRELTYKTVAQKSYMPTYVGPGVPTYTFTSGTPAVAANPAADGTLTTLKSGTTVITATVEAGTITDAEKAGWYFTSLTKTDNYTLTVNEQDVVVTFAKANPTATDLSSTSAASGTEYLTNVATVKSALENTDLTTPAVTYAVDDANFDVTTGGVLKSTAALTAGETYTVTVTATFGGEANKYNPGSQTYTVTFKAE